ncbi:TIR domain-containing protein [Salegentibacter mishustinae]|uniref:TIR domain-containing protein n=1 Tax=Salegentibacter mishustinae TaxID=270918 RepID=A0A0Q9ZPR6_9FLAO|nr:TIR domain-containing protein [Salegentibacter mishustinae]KRG30552.1 hypothetical protein APR42_01410 [Salegentibacter mishustinae]PNW23443.1 hypothetical protein APB85_01405 [Salegentibacter mishustinae]PZX66510.1 TIR domain-containing protein [Salegentibacter mishustinae]GGW82957.1 hypothetical protein GCM10008086_08710 [Salegentibacter mishustinae]
MLITKNHLNKFETSYFDLPLTRISNILLREAKNEKGTEKNLVTVFLSHKHNEEEILKKVIKLLENIGVDVYVDWQDDEMPKTTSGETAIKIKKKIIENKKFILLATKDAIDSKWCNWELGYGDSHKFSDDIAIMPIVEIDSTWPGNEYLQIYPVIKTEYNYSIGSYYVEFKNKKIDLEEWLKK